MNQNTTEPKNFLFPVFFKLEELRVLLVGAGPVGVEKATSILANSPNTRLQVIAELISPEMVGLQQTYPQLTIINRAYIPSDLETIQLLFLAINNISLSAEIRQQAQLKNILVNVADTPQLCDFYLGAIVTKGSLKIAISTNGKSPTVAKRIKEMLQETLPEQLDKLLDNMQKIRNSIQGDFSEKVRKLNEVTEGLGSKEK